MFCSPGDSADIVSRAQESELRSSQRHVKRLLIHNDLQYFWTLSWQCLQVKVVSFPFNVFGNIAEKSGTHHPIRRVRLECHTLPFVDLFSRWHLGSLCSKFLLVLLQLEVWTSYFKHKVLEYWVIYSLHNFVNDARCLEANTPSITIVIVTSPYFHVLVVAVNAPASGFEPCFGKVDLSSGSPKTPTLF